MKKYLFYTIVTLVAATMSVGIVSCSSDRDDIVIDQNFPVSVGYQNVKNGESIDLTANVTGSYNGKPVRYTVVYYCDDNEIGSSIDNTNNYLFKYVVKDLSSGLHTLSYKGSYEEGSTILRSSATIMTINVIE